MTELIYEYVKDKGWVLESCYLITFSCGTRCRIEKRLPKYDERFTYFNWRYEPEMFLEDNRTLNYDKFINEYSKGHYTDNVRALEDYNVNPSSTRIYFVFVPL